MLTLILIAIALLAIISAAVRFTIKLVSGLLFAAAGFVVFSGIVFGIAVIVLHVIANG